MREFPASQPFERKVRVGEGAQSPALPSGAPEGVITTWWLWRDWILKLEGGVGSCQLCDFGVKTQ